MPLRTVRGVLGGICLHYVGDRGPGDEQYGLLVSFATAAAIAIENAELYTGAQQNLRQMTDLLKELNHRVGNNLEILSGLLRMQMRRVSEPSALDALRGSYARIQSIATVHDLLTTTNLVSTTLDELVRVLLSAISVAVVPPGCQIRFHVEGRDIKVSSEQATILGLVVNEMVTNAVRHGLHDRQEGDVWINGRVEGGNVVITIEDNGRGVPPGFELEQQTGLGLQITSRMVSIDLKGQLTMANRPESGSLVTISFPYQPDGARPSRPPATVAS
jgi:two-component system, sensor histidine kinase PdtaS